MHNIGVRRSLFKHNHGRAARLVAVSRRALHFALLLPGAAAVRLELFSDCRQVTDRLVFFGIVFVLYIYRQAGSGSYGLLRYRPYLLWYRPPFKLGH